MGGNFLTHILGYLGDKSFITAGFCVAATLQPWGLEDFVNEGLFFIINKAVTEEMYALMLNNQQYL